MKKLASVFVGLLLCVSTTVFAVEHSNTAVEHTNKALEHANAAVVHGKAGHAPILVEHAKSALNHTLEASLVAKGVPKTHIDAAADSLQKSIDEGELGHAESATKAAEEGVAHLETSKRQ
jgi:HEPN domain-containing protein